MGSSLNLSATVEALMLGIVMGTGLGCRKLQFLHGTTSLSVDPGSASCHLVERLGTVPITVFGLLVSAPKLEILSNACSLAR